MEWGAGTRIVNNFTIPRRALERVNALATEHGVTPFLVFLGIFCLAMARWSKMERFPVRVLGDKRSRLDLAGTVGLMFCADPVEIQVLPGQDFAQLMRAILVEYEASLALRLPTLHYFAPHFVRPDIEPAGYPNRIPAVFNYYSGGTARERAERRDAPDTAGTAWPPAVTRLPSQNWTRRSAPLFLHLMDMGNEMTASLHFLADVVNETDEQAFIATLLGVWDEVVPI
jgi:non-ribosomal peptide synthetase component F